MKLFRRRLVQRLATCLTAIVFLNMSFFMLELTILEIGRNDKKMLQDLVTMLARVSEEEKGTQSSAPDSSIAKEVDLYMHLYTSELSAGFTLITTNLFTHLLAVPRAGMHDTPLQPPEA